jgi:hypothetical protein
MKQIDELIELMKTEEQIFAQEPEASEEFKKGFSNARALVEIFKNKKTIV